MVLDHFRHDRSGLIADGHAIFPHDRSSVLLGCLTGIVRAVWDRLSAAQLFDSTRGLEAPLVDRLRAWILGYAPDVGSEILLVELETAVASRDATGDDIGLVDAAIKACDRAELIDLCGRALGAAPTVAEVSQTLGSDQLLPERWMQAHTWVTLLPPDLAESWTQPCQVLAASYGELQRDDLLRSDPVEIVAVGSPIGVEELRSLPPEQAAEAITLWQAGPSDWRFSARELARRIETLVEENPSAWMTQPVGIAAKLRHPMYISHYLNGAAKLAANTALPVAGLLDVIEMVWAEPWPPGTLGRERYDYGWREAKRSAVDLIEALADADADLGDSADQAWDTLESAARDLSETTSLSNNDPRRRAINRSSTRALQAAVRFVGAELRASRPLRPAFEDLLSYSLRLEGSDGAEYRAILAPYIPSLRHALPEWTNNNLEVMFGSAAPDNLAQFTMDMVIQWSNPSRWLLDAYPEMIQNAAARHVDRAMTHLLIGMLWERSGYQIGSIVRFLESDPALAADAGRVLSTLIGDDATNGTHIEITVNLWEALLGSKAASSLEGFGWMFKVKALDTDRWTVLTLATLRQTSGRLRCKHEVAERTMSQPVTTTKLALLDHLIRGQADAWTLRLIANPISGYLNRAGTLVTTVEYKKLRTALLERGMIEA